MLSSTIISMIPTSQHVRSVYVGTGSNSTSGTILSALKSGKLSPEQIKQTMCMDESTIEMAISKAVSEEMEASGATCMDAPVSGGQLQITPLQTFVHANVVLDLPAGVIGAKNATLTIMVGSSSQDAFERAKPVLETMGKKVLRCGDLGAGLAAKIANK